MAKIHKSTKSATWQQERCTDKLDFLGYDVIDTSIPDDDFVEKGTLKQSVTFRLMDIRDDDIHIKHFF